MASGLQGSTQHEPGFLNMDTVLSNNGSFHNRREYGLLAEESQLCVIEPDAEAEVVVKRKKRKRTKHKKSLDAYQDLCEHSGNTGHSQTIHIPETGSVATGHAEETDSVPYPSASIHGGDVGSPYATGHAEVTNSVPYPSASIHGGDVGIPYGTELTGLDNHSVTRNIDKKGQKVVHVRIDPSVVDNSHSTNMKAKKGKDIEMKEKSNPKVEVKDETFQGSKVKNDAVVRKPMINEKTTENGRVGSEMTTDEEDEKFLAWVKAQFIKVAGEDNSIDLSEFKQALGIKNNYFAERFFDLFDKERSKTIDLSEFIDGMTLLTKGTPRQKLKFLFDVYDVDGNGAIDPDELKIVMQHCIEESDLQLSEEALETLTVALFEHADADGSGMISYDELCDVLEKHPDVMKNLTISAANWMKPPKSKSSKSSGRPEIFTKKYWINNKKSLAWVFIYIIINIGLFLTCIRYREQNAAVIIARGCGMCLNFNCAFILVLMLKNTLTLLRMTPLVHVFPIDDNVAYHRAVGYIIVVLALVHTVAHYVNVGLTLDDAGVIEYWEYVFTLKAEVGYVGPGFAYISGFILTIILLIMFVCALPFIRSNGLFQVFYFTHLLYLVFWLILILHGPIFWYFFLLPGFIFLLEKTIPPFLRRAKGTTFSIKTVTLLPSKVTHLVVAHSGPFHFKPGDYVFIKIPAIARFEYHPFTISSAPERDGEFWLHVRSAGHWTKNLYKYFEDHGTEETQKSRHSVKSSTVSPTHGSARQRSATSGRHKESSIENWKNKYKTKEVNIEVSIRGPYGTPTREIFDTEHAVLIACGIGVTPFASILQSISYRVHAAKKTCPHCTHTFLDQDHVTQNMKLKKVDFVWINRQQHAFEWFVSLLQQLEEEEAADTAFDHFLDMQMYMTSALSMNDMKGFGLQVALDAMQKKGQRNVLTGLRSSLKPGRPNWDKVFSEFQAQNKGSVKVFFCGNPALAKMLKASCDQFGFAFSKETF